MINNFFNTYKTEIKGKDYVLTGGNNRDQYRNSESKYSKLADKNPFKKPDGTYKGFDCCGGVMHSLRLMTGYDLREIGVDRNGTNPGIFNQAWAQEKVEKKDLKPGDLIFVDGNGDGKMTHVMVFQGKKIVADAEGKTKTVYQVMTTKGNENGGKTEINVPFNPDNPNLQFRRIDMNKLKQEAVKCKKFVYPVPTNR